MANRVVLIRKYLFSADVVFLLLQEMDCRQLPDAHWLDRDGRPALISQDNLHLLTGGKTINLIALFRVHESKTSSTIDY